MTLVSVGERGEPEQRLIGWRWSYARLFRDRLRCRCRPGLLTVTVASADRIGAGHIANARLVRCHATGNTPVYVAFAVGPSIRIRGSKPGRYRCLVQPIGYTPAPVDFSIFPGSKAQSEAESIARDFLLACGRPISSSEQVTTSSRSENGDPNGPNAGQKVWLVRVDVEIADPSSAQITVHDLIEINAATGVPTLIAYS